MVCKLHIINIHACKVYKANLKISQMTKHSQHACSSTQHYSKLFLWYNLGTGSGKDKIDNLHGMQEFGWFGSNFMYEPGWPSTGGWYLWDGSFCWWKDGESRAVWAANGVWQSQKKPFIKDDRPLLRSYKISSTCSLRIISFVLLPLQHATYYSAYILQDDHV